MAIGELNTFTADGYETTDLLGSPYLTNIDDITVKKDPIYFESSDSKFYSDGIIWRFSDRLTHLEDNPTNVYIEAAITYTVTGDSSVYYQTEIEQSWYSGGKYLEFVSVVDNLVSDNTDDGVEKTATVRIYADKIENDFISKEDFGFYFRFFVNNPSNLSINVTVSAITFSLYSGTGGSVLIVYEPQNEKYLDFDGVADLGLHDANSASTASVRLFNFGDTPLVIDAKGITDNSSVLELVPQIDTDAITLFNKQYVDLPFVYSGVTDNTNYVNEIKILSNASNEAGYEFFRFYINFGTLAEGIAVSKFTYNNISISNNDVLSLGVYPQNTESEITIAIKNEGDSDLIITSIQFQGSIRRSVNSISDGSVISVDATNYIKFFLVESTVGLFTGAVIVNTNDAENAIFKISFAFNIRETAKLVIKSGLAVNAATEDLSDGNLINFGAVERNRNISRTYILTNGGVLNDIRLDAISISNSNAIIQRLPTLPFTLVKNNANSTILQVEFQTEGAGYKVTDLIINYSEIT